MNASFLGSAGLVAATLALGMVAVTSRAAAADKARGKTLQGKRIAILVADGFEEAELTGPKKALDDAGVRAVIVSPEHSRVRAWNEKNWSDYYTVDLPLDEAKADQFDALLLPGGVMNPDKLRTIPKAVEFVKAFFTENKPVAAICHGPWMLVEADVVRGRTLTSWPSLKTDIRNAGGTWVDKEVVNDHGLVTSRKPADIPAFNRQMLEAFKAGAQQPSASR
jgi:protease I